MCTPVEKFIMSNVDVEFEPGQMTCPPMLQPCPVQACPTSEDQPICPEPCIPVCNPCQQVLVDPCPSITPYSTKSSSYHHVQLEF